MFDFTGLVRKFQEQLHSNQDVKQYALLMWEAISENNDEFFNNHVNPYPITITYYGQDKNQLLEWSMFEYKTYTFNDKIYDIKPQYFVETLVIASNVKSIPNEMFECLVALKTVTFESGSILEHMGNSCFADCHSLQHINLPHTVKTLGQLAFKNCYWLSTVNMDSCKVMKICDKTFLNCYNLKKVLFPSTLKRIEHCGFENCFGLTHVSLPHGFCYFGECAMKGCKSLKVMYLPSNYAFTPPEDFVRHHEYSVHPELMTYSFDKSLILLFDKVEGVEWGTVTSDNGVDDDNEENKDRIDELMEKKEYEDEDDDEVEDDYDIDSHDDDDENEDRPIFKDAQDFSDITPFISLFDITKHVRSIEHNADPSVVMKWLRDNSEGFYVAVVKHQMSMLHILCHFPSNCNQVHTCVNELMRRCPLMIECVDKTGRTALHHLIEFNPKRDEDVVRCVASHSNGTVVFAMIACQQCETDVKLTIIESIASAKHEALKCEDEETGLMPFMIACMGEEYNLSVGYKLLLNMPDYLKNLQ